MYLQPVHFYFELCESFHRFIVIAVIVAHEIDVIGYVNPWKDRKQVVAAVHVAILQAIKSV